MGAVEKKAVHTAIPLGYRGPYKSVLIITDVGETIDDTNIITLDDMDTANDEEIKLRATTIISVRAHVAATGAAQAYSYATNVLTKSGGAATRDVIEVLYI